ncbi:MAG TPA: hypothetical protein VG097_11785 [Gemmata sp.]|jgi:hypothetical protein|nr:hypothetical protein [Gemmata sp.]
MGNHYISAGPRVSFNRAKEILSASPIWQIVCPDDETIYAWCAPADDWISLYCNGPLDLERTTFCDDDGNPLPDQEKARAEYVPTPHGEDPVKTETMGPFDWLEESLQTRFLDIYGPGIKHQCESWDDSTLTPYAELHRDDTPLGRAPGLPEHRTDESSELSRWKTVHDYIANTKNMSREEYERFAIGEHPGYLERKQHFLDVAEKRQEKMKEMPDVSKEDDDAFFQELLDQGKED